MYYEPWNYFLVLERSFIETTAYVEPHEDNFTAYSNKYAALLLLLGSEIDVVAKLLCEKVEQGTNAKDIVQYQSVLCASFFGVETVEIDIPRYNLSRRPWAAWGVKKTPPDWWRAYNAVKHDRLKAMHRGNLQHALDALCGLFALNLYFYRPRTYMEPFPALLDYGFPNFIINGNGRDLPGF